MIAKDCTTCKNSIAWKESILWGIRYHCRLRGWVELKIDCPDYEHKWLRFRTDRETDFCSVVCEELVDVGAEECIAKCMARFNNIMEKLGKRGVLVVPKR